MAEERKRGLLWRSVFWSFRRGSWQYDLIVLVILAFIFLTPREFFGDQPRPPVVRQMQELGDSPSSMVFWVDSASVPSDSDEERDARLKELLHQRSGRSLEIVSVERSSDPEGVLQAYIVYARP